MSKERRVIEKLKRQESRAKPKTSFGEEIYIPNHSGDHRAGKQFKTPDSDYDIANKLYVDTAIQLSVSALGNLGSTEEIDWDGADHFTGTLDADVTLTFANDTSGEKRTLAFSYDGTAQRTITWPSMKWAGGSAPSAPSASGEVLIATVVKLGTTIYGSAEIFS